MSVGSAVGGGSGRRRGGSSETGAAVLDLKRANMIGIVMSRFKSATSSAAAGQLRDVAAALREQRTCDGGLSLEDAQVNRSRSQLECCVALTLDLTCTQALIPLIPTSEEAASIRAAADKGAANATTDPRRLRCCHVHPPLGLPLGPPEKFLHSLASICALEVRCSAGHIIHAPDILFMRRSPARHLHSTHCVTYTLRSVLNSWCFPWRRLAEWQTRQFWREDLSKLCGQPWIVSSNTILSTLTCRHQTRLLLFTYMLGAALRSLLEVALVFGNTLNKVSRC